MRVYYTKFYTAIQHNKLYAIEFNSYCVITNRHVMVCRILLNFHFYCFPFAWTAFYCGAICRSLLVFDASSETDEGRFDADLCRDTEDITKSNVGSGKAFAIALSNDFANLESAQFILVIYNGTRSRNDFWFRT